MAAARALLTTASLEVQEDRAPVCLDDPRPFIPEGEYEAFCSKASCYRHPRYKRDVIALVLRIFGGQFEGTRLERYYAGRRGSAYYREWTIANGDVPPRRRDRLALRRFQGKLFKVRVATVRTAADGVDLPSGLRYSKVSAILELLTTNETFSAPAVVGQTPHISTPSMASNIGSWIPPSDTECAERARRQIEALKRQGWLG